jgi:putative lipoprotein
MVRHETLRVGWGRARKTLTVAVVLLRALTARAADQPFGSDKALHFSVSVGLAGAAYAGTALLLRQPVEARLAAGVGLSLFAGVAKELADTQGFGDPSVLDLTWDVIGTCVGTALAWLIDQLFVSRTLGPLAVAAPR